MTTIRSILNVCIFTYDGAIDLRNLDSVKHEKIIDVKPSELNKNKDILTSMMLRLRRVDGAEVCLRIYAAYIKIHTKKAKSMVNKIDETLKQIGAEYQLNVKGCDIVITFSSFGQYQEIDEVENILADVLSANYLAYLKSIDKAKVKVHMSASSTGEQINEIFHTVSKIFDNSVASPRLLPSRTRYIINNSSYNLGSHLSVYRFAQELRRDEQFLNAGIIYTNLGDHPSLTIVLPLHYEDDGAIWRKNYDVTYTIQSNGVVTQTCPTVEQAQEFHERLLNAYRRIKDRVVRQPIIGSITAKSKKPSKERPPLSPRIEERL